MAIDRKAENIVYTGDADGIVCLWDLSARTSQRVLRMEPSSSSSDGDRLHLGAISGMVLMDGHLLSVGWDDQLRWTIGKESTESLTLPAQPKKIIRGKKLLVILTCQGIILLKEGGTSIAKNVPISYEALCGCVSTDDSTLYIGGNDRTVHVYHVNKSADALIESFSLVQCHSQPITALRLSHDESKLASADSRDVCVWNVSERLSAIIPQGRWCFHRLRVNALVWSKNDSILASGSEDDSIYIWNLEQKMKRVHYPFAHRGGITEVDFLHSVDGMQLLSVGNDGCMNLWDITNDVKKTFSL
jgi:WD40 repeat protein